MPPQPPGVIPRARRKEGTTFPVTAGRGVKRIAFESHSRNRKFRKRRKTTHLPQKPVLPRNKAIPVPTSFRVISTQPRADFALGS